MLGRVSSVQAEWPCTDRRPAWQRRSRAGHEHRHAAPSTAQPSLLTVPQMPIRQSSLAPLLPISKRSLQVPMRRFVRGDNDIPVYDNLLIAEPFESLNLAFTSLDLSVGVLGAQQIHVAINLCRTP